MVNFSRHLGGDKSMAGLIIDEFQDYFSQPSNPIATSNWKYFQYSGIIGACYGTKKSAIGGALISLNYWRLRQKYSK